jgi:AcrR family transcriptional regulator
MAERAQAQRVQPERVHTQQGRDRRADLLAHAERLFLERGVAETRMVDIAEAAGVAKGLAYWYFDGKEALILAIALDVRERLRQAQLLAVAGVDASLERLYVGTCASVLFIHEHWNLYGIIHSSLSDPRHATALGETSRVHAEDTIEVIEQGQADGTIRADEVPALLAQGNQGVVNHLVLSLQRGQIDGVEVAAHAAARYVVHASAATPELARTAIAAHRADG